MQRSPHKSLSMRPPVSRLICVYKAHTVNNTHNVHHSPFLSFLIKLQGWEPQSKVFDRLVSGSETYCYQISLESHNMVKSVPMGYIGRRANIILLYIIGRHLPDGVYWLACQHHLVVYKW